MQEDLSRPLLPDWLQRALLLLSTVAAVLLYAGILGSALVRTVTQEAPEFSDNMVRAAGLLSGLIGAVVTAGFARSQRPIAVQIVAEHPMGGQAITAWTSLQPVSLIHRNLTSLAATLGLLSARSLISRSGDDQTQQAEMTRRLSAVEWIALLYCIIYFVTGIAAFAITIVKPTVPGLVANSGWVWLGTAITSTYSFLGLNLRA